MVSGLSSSSQVVKVWERIPQNGSPLGPQDSLKKKKKKASPTGMAPAAVTIDKPAEASTGIYKRCLEMHLRKNHFMFHSQSA